MTMTNDDKVCEICEEYIFTKPTLVEDSTGCFWITEEDDSFDDIADFYSQHENIALWHGDGQFVCMSCVIHAYETRFGEPIKKRIRHWWRDTKYRLWRLRQ